MLDLFGSGVDLEVLKNIFGAAASSDFTRTLSIFALAAYVHAKQVRKEIKLQFGELVGVLREDLEAQKSVLDKLANRVDTIEFKLNIKGEPK